MNGAALWRDRLSSSMVETMKYMRYMANGGLLFTVYFVLLYGLVVYGRFLDEVDTSFPSRWMMAACFLLAAAYRSSRTFLVEADQVFLLPTLSRLQPFMNRVRLYNALFGMVRAVVPFLFVSALYVRTESVGALELLVLFASIAIFGAASNLSKLENVPHRIVLLYAFGAGILVLVDMEMMSGVVAFFLMIVLHLKRNERLPLLEWTMLERESRERFYRVANWFVDVPRMPQSYRPRRLLSRLVERTAYAEGKSFDYLYRKQFIRSTDGLGLILRLTMVAAVFMWLGQGNAWMVALAIPAFVGVTVFQLAPFTRAINEHLLTRLLPLPETGRQEAKRRLIRFAYGVQAVILSLAGLVLGGGTAVLPAVLAAVLIGEYYARK